MSNDVIIETDYTNLTSYFPFKTMRTGQDYILSHMEKHLLDPKIRFILVEAGTGIGKSALALAAAGASNSAYISTANKFLQDQYNRDFSDIMVDLKGRSNYRCNCYHVPDEMKSTIGEFYNCGNSPCRNTPETRGVCAKERACEYHRQLSKAARASITSFNFAAALAFLNYMQGFFKKRNLLVCDECHNLPNWITNFVSIDITAKTLKDLELKPVIPEHDSVDDYASFITDVQHEVNYMLASEELLEPKLIHKLENFQKKLDLFDIITDNKENMRNFVMEKVYDHDMKKKIVKICFQPVVIADIIHEYLFKYADKVLLLSATILDFETYTEMMGIDPSETAIIRVPSIFPVENRPIYTHMSVGYINTKNLDSLLPDMVCVVKAILDHYPDYKGIIHGVTYKICDYLYENLDSDRILYPRKAEHQKEFFDRHVASEFPTILLSPSMTEGVDLKHDISRIQIMVKTPYAYLGNPVLKARMELYENYYNMLTALNLTQAYGRSIRSEDDFCFTFILDKCFLSFMAANKDILQSSFIEAVQKT